MRGLIGLVFKPTIVVKQPSKKILKSVGLVAILVLSGFFLHNNIAKAVDCSSSVVANESYVQNCSNGPSSCTEQGTGTCGSPFQTNNASQFGGTESQTCQFSGSCIYTCQAIGPAVSTCSVYPNPNTQSCEVASNCSDNVDCSNPTYSCTFYSYGVQSCDPNVCKGSNGCWSNACATGQNGSYCANTYTCSGPVCGDGTCEASENDPASQYYCPQDCGGGNGGGNNNGGNTGTGLVSLNPSALGFNSTVGNAPVPSSQVVVLTNTGTGNLSWTASTDQSWCNVSPTSGSGLVPNGTTNLTVSPNQINSPGTNICHVTVTDSNSPSDSGSVLVTYSVAGSLPPPTVTLTASPNPIAAGSTSNLTWSSTNATSCTASGGWSGTLGPSGTQATAALYSHNIYSIYCTGPGGNSNTASVTVNVNNGVNPATNLSATCPAPYTTAYATWTNVAGYNPSYSNGDWIATRYNSNSVAPPPGPPTYYTGYTWPIPAGQQGSTLGNSFSFPTTPGASYTWWVTTITEPGGKYSVDAISSVNCVPPAPDTAICQSFTVNNGQPVTAGSTFPVSAQILNAGTNTWTNAGSAYGFTVVPWNGGNPQYWNISGANIWNALPSSTIAPNSSGTFSFHLVAPSSAGTYPLSMEMLHNSVGWFNNNGPDPAQATPTVCTQNVTVTAAPTGCSASAVGTNQMTGCQFNSQDLSGSTYGNAPTEPTVSNPGDNVTPLPDNNIGSGVNGLTSNYSMRWKGKFTFTGGTYNFTHGSDDGMRVYIDDNNDNAPDGGTYLVNDWNSQGYYVHSPPDSATISAGQHQIDVEYFQGGGGAEYSLSWSLSSGGCNTTPGSNQMTGCVYGFNGASYGSYIGSTSGSPTTSGNADTFTALPYYDVLANSGNNTQGQTTNFATRWYGNFNFTGGSYTFTSGSDDGNRVYVDGTKIIDDWQPQGYTTNSDTITLAPGSHTVEMEYFQDGGGAEYSLGWAWQSLPDTCSGAACGTCSGGICSGGGGGTSSNSVVATPSSCPSTGIALAWDASAGATSYNIYRNTSNTVPGSVYHTSATNSYSDTTTGGPYYYWVQAVAGAMTSPDKVAANSNSTGGVSATNSCGGGAGPATLSLSNTCGASSISEIDLSWSSVGSATGYNVYRNSTNNYAGATKIASNISPTSYADTNITGGNLYYYWVTGIVGGIETSPTPVVPQAGPNPEAALSCGTVNMLDSDKDVVAVNGIAISPVPGACNSHTDPLPSTTVLQAGNTLTFRINLCTDSSSATSTNVSITDNLINLKVPGSGNWNAKYCAGGSCNSITPTIAPSPAAPNQQLTFSGLGSIPAGHVDYYILFDALLATPSGFSGTSARFQNSFCTSYTGGGPACSNTPLLPFYIGNNTPTINEVP